jgi:hypothetical protein
MGTPETTDNMINFVDTVRKDIRPDMKGPIVVHCRWEYTVWIYVGNYTELLINYILHEIMYLGFKNSQFNIIN